MGFLKRVVLAIWIAFLVVIWLVGPASYVLTQANSPLSWGIGLVCGAALAFCVFWFRDRWSVSARWSNVPFEILAPLSIVSGVVGVEVLLWLAGAATFR